MNAAEHKAEAESLIEDVNRGVYYGDRTLQLALIHATLATIPDPKPTPVGYL